MSAAVADALAPGFSDPVHDAQATFRAVLEAISRPGRVVTLPEFREAPAPLSPAAAAIVLTLADLDTPVWLDRPLRTPTAEQFIRFHTGAPIAEDGGSAAFAVLVGAGAPTALEALATGSDEYPDRSATAIVQVAGFSAPTAVQLTGPGVGRDPVRFAPGPLPPAFWAWAVANARLFPRGIDLLFVAGDQVAGLPRSTRVDG